MKLSKEKYSISEAKEKLELAISTARIEEEGKGEKLTIDKLGKIDDDEISVGDTSKTPVDIICKDYKFSVDSDFNITYVGKAEGTVIAYTTEPDDDLAVNALGNDAYDNDFTTYETYSGTHRYYKIDPECWGKYITFYSQTPNDYTGGLLDFGSSYNKINDIKADWMYTLSGVSDGQLCSRSVMIPEGCYWGAYSTGRGGTVLDISEVWCSTENLSGQVYSNDNRPQK